MTEKKKINFTIMSDKKAHKTLDLSSIAPVIIDVEEKKAFIDMGALHARSAIERGIKFDSDPSLVSNGKPYVIVWVSSDKDEKGPFYHGLGACRMVIDQENRRGYKILAEHVNTMDAAMKGRYNLDTLDEVEKGILREFLINHKPEMWENSPVEFHNAFLI